MKSSFSLRTLIVAVTVILAIVIAVVASWRAYQVQSVNVELRHDVELYKGIAESYMQRPTLDDKQVGAFLALSEMDSVTLQAKFITISEWKKEKLELIKHFPDVRYLKIRGAITDEELSRFEVFSRLEYLEIADAAPSDRGISCLRHMSELRNLILFDASKISDKGLSIIAERTELETLGLSGATSITSTGWECLGNLGQLRSLSLWDSSLDDVGMKQIGRMNALEYLWIPRTQITDAGLTHLGGLSKLNLVSFPGTSITDAGLDQLRSGSPSLRRIVARNCSLSTAAIDRFNRARPNVEVVYDNPNRGGDPNSQESSQ